MLVPVQGGVANLQKRNRTIHDAEAQLATIPIPEIFIFNVGPREWRDRPAAGKMYTIPACEPGADYSEPLAIKALSVIEFDPADGGNNMGVLTQAALSGVVGEKQSFGIADDIIGKNSTAAALDIGTTNLEWFGVFVSQSNPPKKAEVVAAKAKRQQMMQMIYSQGKQLVEQNIPENPNLSLRMQERKLYNEAAAELGYKPLFGDENLSLENCPECREPIKPGATFCKHCQQPIDPASVAARAKKRAKANAEAEAEEEAAKKPPAR